ncbi:NADH:ubiquinone oxidoreductase subunit 6 (subunit J)/NADH:ubiquinone oxidoreductase subunit K [Bradyrhizobium sp. USDA 4474]
MILPALFFYLFAGVCVASAVMVIVSRNPVHSVLFLILAFVNASGLFVLMGAEFLAMILIVVYVGAVAVLFLFVIMMLDVDFIELREGFIQYLPVGVVIGGIFLFELLLTVGAWVINPTVSKTITAPIPANVSNTEALGLVLYTRYVHYFQLSGMVLLVAMIGAIVLTLRHKASVKRQDINVQNARTPEMAMAMRKVAPGQGLSDADAAEWVKMTIGLGHYLAVGAILFTLGILGIFLNRKNIIVILMSIELILLSVNVNLVAFSTFLGDIVGQVFALLVLTVAAAEAAIGLAILVVYFRNRGSIAVEDVNLMKG